MRKQLHGGMNLILSACVIAACAGLAMAQPDRGRPAGEKPVQKDGQNEDDVLRGPKVRDDAKPGEMGRFAPREGRRDEIPHSMVVRFLKKMASEETPADVRLSAEQVTKIEEFEKAHQEAIKAYRETHRDEVMQLREVLPPQDRRRVDAMLNGPEGQRGRPGEGRPGEGRPEGKPGEGRPGAGKPGEGKPDAAKPDERRRGPRDGDEMAPGDDPMKFETPAGREEVEKAKGRLKEIGDGAPKPGPVTEQMYAVLTEPQREHAKKEIQKQRDEMRKRAEERAKGREGKEGDPAKGAPMDAKPARPGEADRMPPGVREKIESLSPDEREKLRRMSPEEKRAYIRTLMGEKAD